MTDRGATALGESLYRQLGQFGYDRLFSAHQHEHLKQEAQSMAARIVGVDDEYARTDPHTSLFIADVTKREPWVDPFDGAMTIQCLCGWVVPFEASYFDHLTEPITESEQRLLDGNR